MISQGEFFGTQGELGKMMPRKPACFDSAAVMARMELSRLVIPGFKGLTELC